MARRIVQVEPGLLRIEQRLRIPGIEIGTDVAVLIRNRDATPNRGR